MENSNYIYTSMPMQKLPNSKKNKQWKESCVDYISGMFGMDVVSSKEMAINYDLYNGEFDESDLKHVTSPYGVDSGFPAKIRNFNIIRSKVNRLLGEELNRPRKMKIYRTSEKAAGDYQEKMKGLLLKYIMAKFTAGMGPEEAAQYEQQLSSGEIMTPPQISKYMKSDYKDTAETVAYAAYSYLGEKNAIDNEFYKGFKDALIASKEVYYTGIVNGNPQLERVNPMYFSHDQSPDLEFIEEGSWAVRKMRMTVAEIWDRLYDKLKQSDLDTLMQKSNSGYDKFNMISKNTIDVNWTDVHNSFDEFANNGCLDVYHTTWKSFKKIGFLSYVDEMGELQETIVSEDYSVTGEEIALTWDWIIEVWEGYKIGNDMYCGIQPLAYQHVSIDNPNSQKLPYTGVVHSNTNSRPKSVVAILKPLQYLYITIWYRIELALARDRGKVISMDVTQIPQSMGMTKESWIHYLSALGVNFFNPFEEGGSVHRGGHEAQFNQFSASDLSMSNVIGSYIQLLGEIEKMAASITGISPQSEGAVGNRELVGSVNAATTNSAYITEPLFHMHRECKKRAIKMLIDTAKAAWKNSDKKSLNFVTDEGQRVFLNISEDFLFEDFDIFIGNDSKEMQNLDMVKQLAQSAIQSGASLLDVVEAVTMDNTHMIKSKLEEIEEKRSKQEQAAAEQENQRQMQQIQMTNQYKEQEYAYKKQELELKKYDTDVKAKTSIYVAELGAYRGVRELDQNNNGIPDPIELGTLALKERQHDSERNSAEFEQSLRSREIELKTETERMKTAAKLSADTAKVSLENKKLDKQLELQREKDNAAMEREKVKQQTALRNKTVGEG
jgi:hypothetical protein